MTASLPPSVNLTFCSFASGTWDYVLEVPDGPVLICDTHHQPAVFEVYETDLGHEFGLCESAAALVSEHGRFYGEGLIGLNARVDRDRCGCGRPANACQSHADALAILARLETERAAALKATPSR